MAISQIKKIELIGLEKDKENILLLLQKLGVVELISLGATVPSAVALPTETNLLELQEAISFLAGLQVKVSLLEGMVKLRPLVFKEELQEIVTNFDYQSLLKELSNLRNHQKALMQHRERLTQEAHLLNPWVHLNIPLDEIRPTRETTILLGTLRTSDYPNLLEDLEEKNLKIFSEVMHQDKVDIYLAVIHLKEEFEQLESILKNHHFNFITLTRHKGRVRNRLLEINREVLVLDDQLQDALLKIEKLSQERFKLMVVYDYLANIKRRQEAEQSLYKQEFTFSLSGWLRNKDLKLLENKLTERFKDIAMFISEPKPDEPIPTALENKPIIRPFEAVTNLYGQPLPTGLDPSSFLAPFFAISFGLCMMDAGYGLILFILMIFYLNKKQISPQGRNLLKLFLYMSIATMFAGAITGSFFADTISRLPNQFNFLKNIQKRFILFDPIKDSLIFLGITLAFGYIQIWTGVFIKFIKDLRRDKFSALILDLPTLLIQTSLLVLALVFFKVLPVFTVKIAGICLFISMALVIYYQWKSNPDLGQKIFWSIFGIYAIITGNFLADTLSFSRIFALGITSGLLGMAINEILLPKSISLSIVGLATALIAFIIWFVTQLIIFAINILGAYVQTSRLQYLEFFSKFFESGGRPFRPFKEEAKYIFLAEK